MNKAHDYEQNFGKKSDEDKDSISGQDSNEFRMLSNFQNDTHSHILELGIVLSKNHPVLSNEQFINDTLDKVKGMRVESI